MPEAAVLYQYLKKHSSLSVLVAVASLSYLTISEVLTRYFNLSSMTNSSSCPNNSILGNSLSEYLKQDKEHVHIVGGGISGLLMGFMCKELKIPFTIYEANENSCGGLLGSERIAFNHDEEWMIAEKAANGVMWTPQVELLCERIGLMERVLSTKKEAKARFFVRNGKLTQFPISYLSVFNLLTWRMWKLPVNSSFQSLDDYFGFYFGEEIKNQFLEPAFAGIFGTTLNNLSVFGTTEIFPKLLSQSLSFPISYMYCDCGKKQVSKIRERVWLSHS
ncbi:predicted protein [Naegleria gruberi]|uniref:Predicted protein n=1 Tax=Naegleria gruberi TaxID=5762 RepID=D2VGW9_NAEGR|nr:uncharacterized protein NAEGRDRAFT_68196 [Naegleria gruberi]EFC43792.1 predicted protein [Naegleria gruberi]|eukprot:XP_002676536.1 predicted protein [Naegleria gruberi strain NEG-M]